MPKKPTTDALEILHRRFYAAKPRRVKALAATRANDEIARSLANLRMEAGLTQAQLAQRVGTTASVISRLECSDYQGHSLAMLRRIADVLNRRVVVRFAPLRRSA